MRILRTGLPLYEGVDWNLFILIMQKTAGVSLFTREWIEMRINTDNLDKDLSSPSLRGSGLKSPEIVNGFARRLSPSLRGSGLKF